MTMFPFSKCRSAQKTICARVLELLENAGQCRRSDNQRSELFRFVTNQPENSQGQLYAVNNTSSNN